MKKFTLIILLFVSIQLFGQEPVLLRDFNPLGADGVRYPENVDAITFNGQIFFTLDDERHGKEFWRTNGTEAGTQLIKDINPDEESGMGTIYGILEDKIIFSANDGVHGSEVWVTQGTRSSTKMIQDLNPGPQGSIYSGVILGDYFYFSGIGSGGRELYRTQGEENSISLVKDFYQGVNFSGDPNSGDPTELTVAGNNIYMHARDEEHGKELWKYDASNNTTTMLKDISPGDQWTDIRDIIAVDDHIFFSVNYSDPQLWYSAGTSVSTYLIEDFSDDYRLYFRGSINGVVYFHLYESSTRDYHLWKSDGTESGTLEIGEDIRINSEMVKFKDKLAFIGTGGLFLVDGETEKNIKYTTDFAVTDSFIYFPASNSNFGKSLWRTDGTDEGTIELVEINEKSYYDFKDLYAVGNQLFFIAETDSFGSEIWTSNGTPEGTFMLFDGTPGQDDSYSSSDEMFYATINGKVIFSGFNEKYGKELWISDGTIEGTSILKDINPRTQDIYYFSEPIEYNGAEYFITDSGLWKTNGNPESTILIKEFDYARGLNKFKDKFYFSGRNENTGITLFVSDGTTEGTKQFLPSDSIEAPYVYLSNNQPKTEELMFFVADDRVYGSELWVTDGTIDGTRMVKDIAEGENNSIGGFYQSYDYALLNNTLYFSAGDEISGGELWKSNGTEEGTQLVSDINPFGNSSCDYFTVFKNEVYFVADDGTAGEEIWKTDGTTEGTIMVAEINPGEDDGVSNWPLTPNGEWLYFAGYNSETGSELWKTDGTEEGTSIVKNIYTEYNNFVRNSSPRNIISFGEKIILTARDSLGYHIYTSDGTEEGTVAFFDLEPYIQSEIIIAGDQILFAAKRGEYGFEVWRADTSLSEIYRMSDITIGSRGSDPRLLNFINGKLYFTAISDEHGRELWTLSPLEINAEIITTSNNFCNEEDTLTFHANISNAGDTPEIQWFINDNLIVDEHNDIFSSSGFSDGDEVKLKVLADNTYWMNSNEVFAETVILELQLPLAEINFSNNVLTASEGNSYQWFLDDQPLGETNREITVTESGTYHVEVTNEQGCSALSDAFTIVLSDIEMEDEIDDISIYPNPFADEIYVSSPNENRVEVKIFNVSGTMLLAETIESWHKNYRISTEGLEPGIYFVRMVSGERIKTIKVIKN